jgi:hypothetical protein
LTTLLAYDHVRLYTIPTIIVVNVWIDFSESKVAYPESRYGYPAIDRRTEAPLTREARM